MKGSSLGWIVIIIVFLISLTVVVGFNGKLTGLATDINNIISGFNVSSVNNLTGNITVEGSAMINVTNFTNGAILITLHNDSFENLDKRESANNISNTALANSKAGTGNCPIGTAAQNTTTGGVQCVSFSTSSGTVTSISGQFPITTSPSPITTTGTISFDNTSLSNLDQREAANNISNTNLANSKAGTGNCPEGQVAMNTTTGGIECRDVVETIQGLNSGDPARPSTGNILIGGVNGILSFFSGPGTLSGQGVQAAFASPTIMWTSNLNTTGFVNSTDLYTRSLLSCSNGVQTDSTGKLICSPTPLGAVSSINSVTGAVLLRGSAMINITGNSTDIAFTFHNDSADNLDKRESANNATQSGQLNALSTNLTLLNQSATNLDTREQANNLTQDRIKANVTDWTNTQNNLSDLSKNVSALNASILQLNISLTNAKGNLSQLSTNVSLFNISATNLDAREIADNTTQSIQLGNTGWQKLASIVYNDTAGVTVSIGTQTGIEKLTVKGNINVTGFVNASQLYLTNNILFRGTEPKLAGALTRIINVTNDYTDTAGANLYISSANGGDFTSSAAHDGGLLTLIAGGGGIDSDSTQGGNGGGVTVQSGYGGSSNALGGTAGLLSILGGNGGSGSDGGNGGDILIKSGASGSGTLGNGGNVYVTAGLGNFRNGAIFLGIDNLGNLGGNVGVGNIVGRAPSAQFELQGGLRAEAGTWNVRATNTINFSAATNSLTTFTVRNKTAFTVLDVDTLNNHVGIGKTNPAEELDVNGYARYNASYGSLVEGTSGTNTGSTLVMVTKGAFYNWTGANNSLSNYTINHVNTSIVTGKPSNMTIGSLGAGTYLIAFTATIQVGTSNDIIHCEVFLNNHENNGIEAETKISNSADERALASTGFMTLSTGDTIDFRCADETSAGQTLTFEHVNLVMNRVGI